MIKVTELRNNGNLQTIYIDEDIAFVEQQYTTGVPSGLKSGSLIVFVESGDSKRVVENVDEIYNSTWTSKWVIITRLDNGVQFLYYRNLIQSINEILGGSKIVFKNSSSPITVLETLSQINSPSIPSVGDLYVSNAEFVFTTSWFLRNTLSDGSQTDYPIPLSFSGITLDNKIIVAKNGNDSQAVLDGIYDQRSPFLTVSAAMAAASIRDTVHVMPGTYSEIGEMVKDQVVLYCEQGVVIQYSNLLPAIPFDDGGSPAKFKIRGYGRFVFGNSQDSILGIKNEGTELDWEFDEIASFGRFRMQQFRLVRFVGRKWEQSARGLFSSRIASVYPSSPEEKKFIFHVEELDTSGALAVSYDQIELGWVEYLTYSIIIKKMTTDSVTTGYPLRLRGLAASCRGVIRVGNYKTVGKTNRPILFMDGDDSHCNVQINHHGEYAGIWSIGTMNALEKVVKRIELVGTFLDSVAGSLRSVNSHFRDNNNHYCHVRYDVVDESINTNPLGGGIYLGNCQRTVLEGVFTWADPIRPIITLDGTRPSAGSVYGLVARAMSTAFTARNRLVGTPPVLGVMSSFGTNPISTDNGGIVQVIESFLINTNV